MCPRKGSSSLKYLEFNLFSDFKFLGYILFQFYTLLGLILFKHKSNLFLSFFINNHTKSFHFQEFEFLIYT